MLLLLFVKRVWETWAGRGGNPQNKKLGFALAAHSRVPQDPRITFDTGSKHQSGTMSATNQPARQHSISREWTPVHTHLTDIHQVGRCPGKDVQNGDDGRREASPPQVVQR